MTYWKQGDYIRARESCWWRRSWEKVDGWHVQESPHNFVLKMAFSNNIQNLFGTAAYPSFELQAHENRYEIVKDHFDRWHLAGIWEYMLGFPLLVGVDFSRKEDTD